MSGLVELIGAVIALVPMLIGIGNPLGLGIVVVSVSAYEGFGSLYSAYAGLEVLSRIVAICGGIEIFVGYDFLIEYVSGLVELIGAVVALVPMLIGIGGPLGLRIVGVSVSACEGFGSLYSAYAGLEVLSRIVAICGSIKIFVGYDFLIEYVSGLVELIGAVVSLVPMLISIGGPLGLGRVTHRRA